MTKECETRARRPIGRGGRECLGPRIGTRSGASKRIQDTFVAGISRMTVNSTRDSNNARALLSTLGGRGRRTRDFFPSGNQRFPRNRRPSPRSGFRLSASSFPMRNVLVHVKQDAIPLSIFPSSDDDWMDNPLEASARDSEKRSLASKKE